MVVSAQKAAFFKYGPAQTFGADFQLAQGQTVTLLERSVGFSRVLGENGITGYVANEDIQLAAVPKATMPLNVAGKRESRSVSQKPGTQKHSHVEASPDTPLFDVSDLPALPVGPAAKPDPVKPN